MHALSFSVTVKHDKLTRFKHNISYAWNAIRTVVDCSSVLCSDAIFFAVNKQNKICIWLSWLIKGTIIFKGRELFVGCFCLVEHGITIIVFVLRCFNLLLQLTQTL